MLTDTEIFREHEEVYLYAKDYWQPFNSSADIATLASAGRTWTNEELKDLSEEGREPIEFNIIRRSVNFFSGYLRDNLNSIVVAPVEGSDQKTADQFTKLMYHIWDKGNGYTTFLDASDECFKSGISLTGLFVDYSKDFVNGDIGFFKRTYNSFLLDPTFERIDLKDCAFCTMRDILDRQIVKQIIPFVDPKIIDEIQGSYRDKKFVSYQPTFSAMSRSRDLMTYDQYYKRTSRERKFLVDERSGFFRDVTDIPSEDMKKLHVGIERIKKLYDDADELGISPTDLPPILRVQKIQRDYIELHIMLNGHRVYVGEDKTGIVEQFPFAPSICYMEPSIWSPQLRIQGIPATIFSNQKQFNKRHMKIIDMMDSTIATGYKYIIGSVADPEDMQQSGQNKMIGVKEDAKLGLDSVQELKGGEASGSLLQYQQVLDDLSLTLSNISESVLGVDDKGNTQVSGKLAEVRIAQGLRGNRKICDNVETTQQVLGGLTLKAIQNMYPPEKIERILGEKPTDQFYDQEFEQYDAVLKEGVRSKSQRDGYYYELVNLVREGIIDGADVKSEIVKNLPMAGQSDLVKSMDEQKALDQEKQKKTEAQEELTMALVNSQKEQNLALAQERRARVISDLALGKERASEAEENRASAALDRAKTITEIGSMREDRLIKVLEYVRMLEGEETVDRERVDDKIHAQAEIINADTEGSSENKNMHAEQELEGLAKQLLAEKSQGIIGELGDLSDQLAPQQDQQ